VSADETKILYSCKNAVAEAYSDGVLYVFDTRTKKSTEVLKIKNMDYDLKSYFIDAQTILVCTPQEIMLVNLGSKRIEKSILKLEKHESLVSCRKMGLDIYFTLLNDNDSKLIFAKINTSLIVTRLKYFSVNVLPTDNFFDVFLIKDRFFIFENGKLYDEFFNTKEEIKFNDQEGHFMIAAGKSSLCFVTAEKQWKMVVSHELMTIENPDPTSGAFHLETITDQKTEKFLLLTGKANFLIDENGNHSKVPIAGIYYGKNIRIKKNKPFELELTY
jgi:hypothetical protein